MQTLATPEVVYPESDGKPMADNTLQLDWIVKLVGNLKNLVRDREDAFAAGNQNWYPVQGHPEVVQAPDAYVVFGRPKGYRGSWKQWEEDDTPMTVVFEVLSPGNDYMEMTDKVFWYEEYGVEECYIFDPEKNSLVAHIRKGDYLKPTRVVEEFVSPRLGVRFDVSGAELAVFYPDGRPFLTVAELDAERLLERMRADNAEQRADKAERQLERISELTRKLLAGQANDDERAELARLTGAL